MNEAPLGLLFGILVLLIFCSAFFSGSETGMMALNRYRLKHLQNKNHRGAKRAAKLLDRPDRLIGLILIGNNLVNILASALATVIAIRLYGDAGIAIATLLLTFFILIFAEVTPKTLAALYPEKIAFPSSLILKPLMWLLFPAVWFINKITQVLLKMLGVDTLNSNNEQLNSDELRTVVDEAGALIPKRHQGMLLNILDLEKVTVNDIMIPRNDVYGIDLTDDDATILNKLQSSEHTRIPLYYEEFDNVLGILHLRNVSRIVTAEGMDKEMMIKEASEPYFIPENTGLHIQLMNFQKEKRRMGIVVDEYGVVIGIVTLEDILEEIVGEFTSNFAGSVDDYMPLDDGSYIINGTASIRDINKSLGWNLPTNGPKTVNGLIMEHLESFPDASVGIQIDKYYTEIIDIKDEMIQSAKITPQAARQRA